MQRAEMLRQIGEIEADLQHRTPDWQERMAAWEETVQGDQPEWTVVSPEHDVSGGQKHYVLADGSILAQGYAPTKHTTEFEVKTDRREHHRRAAGAAQRSRTCRWAGRAGRSTGTCALTEFRVEAGAGRRLGENGGGEDRQRRPPT